MKKGRLRSQSVTIYLLGRLFLLESDNSCVISPLTEAYDESNKDLMFSPVCHDDGF